MSLGSMSTLMISPILLKPEIQKFTLLLKPLDMANPKGGMLISEFWELF